MHGIYFIVLKKYSRIIILKKNVVKQCFQLMSENACILNNLLNQILFLKFIVPQLAELTVNYCCLFVTGMDITGTHIFKTKRNKKHYNVNM